MSQFMIGPEADLTALETAVWLYNIKHVAYTYWDNSLRDVQTGQDVDISTLTDEQINDRDRFPLFGYIGDRLNTAGGYTKRWAAPEEVTHPDSAYPGQYFMAVPEEGRPYNAETTARILQVWNALLPSFPGITVVEIDRAELIEIIEE